MRLLRIILVMLGAVLTAAVATRGYGLWRLARSRAQLAATFTPAELARVRARLPATCSTARGPRLQGPLHELAAPVPAEVDLPRCARLLDEATSRGEALVVGDEALG